MATYLTVVPSYGADYKSKAEVAKAWAAGKDFTIKDWACPDDGRQINKQDADKLPEGTVINVRFSRLTKIAALRRVKGEWKAS